MIYIVGSGAIGKALAVFLSLDHRAVTLLRGSIDNQIPYTENVGVVLADGTRLQATIEISTFSNFAELGGLVVLTNKSYGNQPITQALKDKAPNAPIVILQNGLGIERVFVDQGFTHIYRSVLFVTSQPLPENQLRFKPVSVSPIGIIKGNGAMLDTIVAQLNSPYFRFIAEADIQPIIWKKAIVNSVFNSICPLLDIDNGIFHRQESVLAIARRVIEECVVIANAQGVGLTVDEIVASLLLISQASDGQLISTLQDIKNKRQTEIETLNFEIVAIARTLQKESLVKETNLLGELTKLKSELSR